MANQIIVTNTGNVQVALTPTPNVQVQISRAAINTLTTVPNANTANYANYANFSGSSITAGTVTNASQPNITSVGTLNGLTSIANITAPFFIGNVVGNISGNFTVPGINTAVLFNQTGNAGASDALTFNYSSNVLTANGNIVANYFTGNGSQLTGIITEQSNVANFANVANAVAVANVSGIGNIAVINLDGNLSNILYGNGIFAAVPNVSNVANANFANFAGNAFSVTGSNVSGEVANANYSTYSGTVITNAQPNITSVGTLTGLVVGGDITPNANITYSLGNNTNRFNNLYLAGNTIILGAQTISANATGISFTGNLSGEASGLSNVVGGNVTGQVANALISGTVYTNAQPNITSVGTLTSVNVSGDALVAGNLTVGGNISYVNVNNLVVQDPVIELGGGPNGAPLTVNDGKDRGTLLHYYTTAPIDAFMGWDNGNGEFAFGSNVTNNLDVMTFNTLGNVRAQTFLGNLTGLASSATVATSANAVAGSNVSGAVSFATTANSVAAANVSGLGNIATTNYDGNGSNVLYGNGGFYALPIISNVANANFANFAGEAFNVSGSNVTGAVANATHAVNSDSANSVAGANVSGQVANALIAGTVYTNAQPNITSVGTLTNLFVTGDIQGYANVSADYILGNGAFLTGVGDFSAALGYHGSFFSNVSQTIASTTTAYPITLNNTSAGTYGIAVTSNSRVTMTYAGTYNIQYSLQFTNTDNAIHNATVWLRKNGTDVPDTNSVYAVPARHGGTTNGQLIGAINYIVDTLANDYYELIWQAESTQISLEYIPPGTTPTSPAAPSAIVTAMQVTNVQAATLSGNLTGNLIGNTFGLTGVSFVNVTGNLTGNVIIGNGSGLTQLVGANVTGTVANATHAVSSDSANSVAGANVSGAVAYATTANSVAVANVSGIGNIATVNLDGSGSNVLYGNGVFATITIPSGTSISNGTSNVNIPAVNGNVNTSVGGYPNVMVVTTGGANINGAVEASRFISNVITGTAPFTVTSTTQVANLNVASAGLATFATTANSVAVANVSGIGNIATVNLTGSSSNVLYGNGVFAAVSGRSGSPGGANTQLQYNNNGAFGGISAVTWDGSNISLGAIGNVKITGGSNNYILATDGTGNLSFSTKTNNLTIGTRTISVNIPITDYTMNVQGRTGNIVVNVN